MGRVPDRAEDPAKREGAAWRPVSAWGSKAALCWNSARVAVAKEPSEREEVAAFVFLWRAGAEVGNRRRSHLA